jgi:hypothetical protein
LVEEFTRAAGECLKGAVNRGEQTNRWDIPKLIDMLLLPGYMSHLGSTRRFHVGFADRGLKKWAKAPASMAQKCGGGVFEGQCAAHIHERSMIDHALTQMHFDDEDLCTEEDPDQDIGGACFHISIERDHPNQKGILHSS